MYKQTDLATYVSIHILMYPGLTLLLGLSLIADACVAADCTFTDECSIVGDGSFLSEWPTGFVIPTVLLFKSEMLGNH